MRLVANLQTFFALRGFNPSTFRVDNVKNRFDLTGPFHYNASSGPTLLITVLYSRFFRTFAF